MKRVRDFLIARQPRRELPPISPDASLEEALSTMRKEEVGRLAVMENGECLGIVQRIDLEVHRERAALKTAHRKLERERRKLEAERRKLGAIAVRDDMYKRSDESREQRHMDDSYYRIGLRAMDHIKAAMQATGKTEPDTILDLPCGYGRVLRFLRAAFPDAELTACDIDRDGVDFCASEFGATPVYSVEDPEEIELQGTFDLIWCGSLFTHLDRDRWLGFLDLFERALTAGGLLLFSTHGVGLHEIMRQPGARLDGAKEQMLRDYEAEGYGYHQHPGKNYGGTMSSPAWVTKQLERLSSLRLVLYFEKAYDFQDVIACVRVRG